MGQLLGETGTDGAERECSAVVVIRTVPLWFMARASLGDNSLKKIWQHASPRSHSSWKRDVVHAGLFGDLVLTSRGPDSGRGDVSRLVKATLSDEAALPVETFFSAEAL